MVQGLYLLICVMLVYCIIARRCRYPVPLARRSINECTIMTYVSARPTRGEKEMAFRYMNIISSYYFISEAETLTPFSLAHMGYIWTGRLVG